MLRYRKTFGDNHNLEAFVAHESTEYRSNVLTGTATGAVTPLSEEISQYNLKEQSNDVVKEEKTEDTEKAETAPEEAKEVETEVKEDYTEMTVKELKAEIAKRNIDTEATRKDDLIQILKENDTSKE